MGTFDDVWDGARSSSSSTGTSFDDIWEKLPTPKSTGTFDPGGAVQSGASGFLEGIGNVGDFLQGINPFQAGGPRYAQLIADKLSGAQTAAPSISSMFNPAVDALTSIPNSTKIGDKGFAHTVASYLPSMVLGPESVAQNLTNTGLMGAGGAAGQAVGGNLGQLIGSIMTPWAASGVSKALGGIGEGLGSLSDTVAPTTAEQEIGQTLGVTKAQMLRSARQKAMGEGGTFPLENAINGAMDRGLFDGGVGDVRNFPAKNEAMIAALGDQTTNALKAADAAQTNIPDIFNAKAYPSALDYINKFPSQEAQLTQQLQENLNLVNTKWDGTISGLNQLKTGIGRDAFGGALTRSKGLDQAFYQDLKDHILAGAENHSTDLKNIVSNLFDQMSQHFTLQDPLESAAANAAKQALNPSSNSMWNISPLQAAKKSDLAGSIFALLSGHPATAVAGLGALGAVKALETDPGRRALSGALGLGGNVASGLSDVLPQAPVGQDIIQSVMASGDSAPKGLSDLMASIFSGGSPVNDQNSTDQKTIDAWAKIKADPYLSTLAQFESSNNPQAHNPTSSAKGLFQFLNGTAKAVGLKDPFDVAQSYDAIQKLTAENKARFGTDPVDLYSAHYLGAPVYDKYLAGSALDDKEQSQVDYLTNILLPRFQKMYAANNPTEDNSNS